MWSSCKSIFYLLNCWFLTFHITGNCIHCSHGYENLMSVWLFITVEAYHIKMRGFGMCSGDCSVHSFGILLCKYQCCCMSLTVAVWTCRWLQHLWLSATALQSSFLWLFLLASYIISYRYDLYSSLNADDISMNCRTIIIVTLSV